MLTALVVCVGLGVGAWATRDALVEWWYLRRLEHGTLEEQKSAAQVLAELRSEKAIPLLVARFRDAAFRGQFSLPNVLIGAGDATGIWGGAHFLEGSPVDAIGSSKVTPIPNAKTPLRSLWPLVVLRGEASESEWCFQALHAIEPSLLSLVPLLRDEHGFVRDGVSRTLAWADPPTTAEIGKALLDPRPEVSSAAAFALELRVSSTSYAEQSLLRAVRESKFWQVRLLSARYLARTYDPTEESVIALRDALSDPDLGVIVEATDSLAKFGERSAPAVEALRRLLDHEVYVLRQEAAEALGMVGPDAESALEELRELADDDSYGEVSNAAEEAIERITGDFD